VSAIPSRIRLIEGSEFRNRVVEIFLIAKRVAKIVVDAGLVRLQANGGAIFGHRVVELAQIVQHDSQIAMGLPEIWTQFQRVTIRHRRLPQIAVLALGQPDIEIDVGFSASRSSDFSKAFRAAS